MRTIIYVLANLVQTAILNFKMATTKSHISVNGAPRYLIFLYACFYFMRKVIQ